jgi:DNA polymerase bacteriophage-type
MTAKYDWPELKPEQMRCTMMMSGAMSLPLGLDQCAQALNLKITKDKQGYGQMLRMSRPRKVQDDGTLIWWEEEARKQRLYAYCKQDVEVERRLAGKLKPLREYEQDLWVLDQKINDRGVPVDLESVDKLIAWSAKERKRLDALMRDATEGAVKSCSDLVNLRKFTGQESLAKGVLAEILPRTAGNIHTALTLRQEAAKSSTKKLDAYKIGTGLDGRMRGILQFYGAISTGRWAGRRVQTQNLPRPGCKQPEIERRIAKMGFNSLAEVADCLRAMIAEEEGFELVCADFSSIEAMVIAWFAGQRDALEVFLRGEDIYKHTAMGIYQGVDYVDIDDDQRQIGKVACIAEGELVLTDHGLIPIEQVPCCARVWDGVEWAAHDGPIYKGVRDVIEYQGLRATADHAVWDASGRETVLDECARGQISLAQTGAGRAPIRLDGGPIPGSTTAERQHASSACPVCGLLRHQVDQHGQPAKGQDLWVSNLFTPPARTQEAGPETDGGKAALHEPSLTRMGELRGPGDRVPVLLSSGGRAVDHEQSGLVPGSGNRSDRQQRPLRSGQSALGNTPNKSPQQTQQQTPRGLAVPPRGMALRKEYRPAEAAVGFLQRRDHRSGGTGRERKTEGVGGDRRQARVYDLLNCGPRNRFTVSGVLVSNCLALGFQGAVGAFNSMGANHGVYLPVEMVEGIVEKWRNSNDKIVDWWYDLERAAMKAIRTGRETNVGQTVFEYKHGHLWITLPSKRKLCLPRAKIQTIEKPWGPGEAITYMGLTTTTHQVRRLSTYGGKLAENIVQATARDILAAAMVRVEDAGYPVVMHIHDELVATMPDHGSLEDFENLMTVVPTWADGIPLAAHGWAGRRYRKD